MYLNSYRISVSILILALVTLACSTLGGAPDPTNTPSATNTPLPTSAPAPTNTLEPTEAPPVTLGEEQRSEEGGFSFSTIPGYTVESLFGLVSLEAPDADQDIGPAILLVGTVEEESNTLDQLFNDFEEDTSDDVQISNRREVMVGDLPGLVADVSGTSDKYEEMAGRVVFVLVTPYQQFTMFGSSPRERWEGEVEPLFDAVMNSISFFEPTEITFEMPEETPEATPMVVETVGELSRQWAVSGIASSQYGDPDYAPSQATGAPDTLDCGDIPTAWASESGSEIAWLELQYEIPVLPTQINIIQSHSPSQVVEVELIDTEGNYYQVYTGQPEFMIDCPYTLTIPVDGAGYQATGIRITIDQSVLETPWNEIDAVELVGVAGEVVSIGETFETPEGFLWRVGGESGINEGEFAALGGMDTDANNLLYVVDNIQGVYVFDADGQQVNVINHSDLNNPADVKVGPDGNIHVAAWGSNQIFVFNPEGELITQFGEEGTGEGQFGTFSPQALAVSDDGNIYVVDDNEDEAGEGITRVQVFSPEGDFLFAFPIEEDYFSAEAMDFGPDGNLYVVGFVGGFIMKFAPDGTYLDGLADEVLNFTGPQGLSIDDAGNFYVPVWTPDVVMKLDPDGNLVSQFGVEVEDGEKAWSEGGFYQLSGVAVLADGSRVFASDWSGDYSYITAFEYILNTGIE